MKKLFSALLLILAVGFGVQSEAAQEPLDISPVSISSQATNTNIPQPRLVTFNQAGPGNINCITDISASASNFPPQGWDLYVLDGGTTVYAITQATMTIVEDFYKGNPLCLGSGATTYVYISTGTTWKLNVNGYSKGR